MKTYLAKYTYIVGGIVFPALANAQTAEDAIIRISDFLNQIIPFFFLLGTVMFLWGILKWVAAGGDEEAARTGRRFAINGIIALAVMLTVWGLVYIAVDFVFPGGSDFTIPGMGSVPTQP